MKQIILVCALFVCTAALAQRETLVVPDGAGDVEDMVTDKDRKYLYTLNHSKAVMWEASSGKQLFTFHLDGENVYGIAVSNDGTKIAISAEFKTYCFSTVTGKLVFKTTEHGGISNGLIFSPDDKTIYVGDEGLWEFDAATGRSDNKLFGNGSGSGKMFYIDNNTKLVVPGGEGWEVYDMQKKEKLYGYGTNELTYLTAMPEQGYIIAGRNYKGVTIFDIKTGKVIKQLSANAYDPVVIPSVNSHQMIFCADNVDAPQRILYNTDNFTIEKKLGTRFNGIRKGAFFGKENVAYTEDGSSLVKFNVANESIITAYEGLSADFGSESFSSMEYNSNSGVLHITTDEDNLKSIDLYRMKPIRHTTVNTGINNLAFSPSGDTIAAFDNAPFSINIRNIVTSQTIRPASGIGMTALERNLYFFSADAGKLYYPEENNRDDRTTLMRYDMKTKATAPVLKTRRLNNVFVNSDKDLLAATEWAYEVKTSFGVWDLNTGKRLFNAPIVDDYNKIRYITLSKDKKFALIMEASRLYYYNIATGQLISTSPELKREEETGIFSADPGSFGASAASSDLSLYAFSRADQDIRNKGELFVYKRSGELVYRINAHSDHIRSILFSPDDKIIYTVSYDHSIKMWDTKTGKVIGTLYLFKDSNDFVFIDPEGRFDGSEEGVKRLYFILGREPLPLDRLFEKYYTPNLYARLVAGEVFNPIPTDIFNPAPLVKIQYAEKQRNLEVDDATPSYLNTTGLAEIMVTASAAGDAVDEIRLFQNGKVLNLVTRNLIIADDKSETATKKYSISLLPGVNEIRAVALNTQRTESTPDIIDVVYNAGTQVADNPVPPGKDNNIKIDNIDRSATLHLVVVGINAYKNPNMALNYALADATAFKDEVEKDAKTIIKHVKTYFVTDAVANKTGISAAFDEVQRNAVPQDVFIFYYAGHGVIANSNKEFYLVPNDVTDLKNVDADLKDHGIAPVTCSSMRSASKRRNNCLYLMPARVQVHLRVC